MSKPVGVTNSPLPATPRRYRRTPYRSGLYLFQNYDAQQDVLNLATRSSVQEAYKTLAKEYGWELLVVNKQGCVLQINDDPASKCNSWNDNFVDWLHHHDIDLVVANGSTINREGAEHIRNGAPKRWKNITETGADLVLMRGTPRPPERVPDCLAEGNATEDCGPTTEFIAETDPLTEVVLPAGAHQIDVLEHVCLEGMTTDSNQCPAVEGNVAVWFDNSHLSNTYVATMTPLIETELRQKVGWLFDK